MNNVLVNSAVALIVAGTLGACGFDDVKNSSTPPPPPLSNWSSQPSESASRLRDVFFINSNQGWIVGDSLTVMSTTNGGANWPLVPANSLLRNLRSVFLISSQTGWMTGGSDVSPTDGQVYVSKMGGAYPTLQETVNRPLNTIFFLNFNTGWAGGDSSVLVRTDNAGLSWTRSTIGTKDNIFDLHFFTPEIGWAATSNGGIYRTKDGTTWTKENLGTLSSDMHAIHFVDTLHGWACGAGNTIVRRELDPNNNVIWTTSSITSESVSAVWNDIFFIGAQMGWVVGSNGVYKTIDGGTTWTKESTNVQINFNAIYMVSSTIGWIVGDSGNILTYTP